VQDLGDALLGIDVRVDTRGVLVGDPDRGGESLRRVAVYSGSRRETAHLLSLQRWRARFPTGALATRSRSAREQADVPGCVADGDVSVVDHPADLEAFIRADLDYAVRQDRSPRPARWQLLADEPEGTVRGWRGQGDHFCGQSGARFRRHHQRRDKHECDSDTPRQFRASRRQS
jgi:hypothetical protein